MTDMREVTEKSGNKLSHQAKGVSLMFAAMPVIVYIKINYDDHFVLGLVASALLALTGIEVIRKIAS